MISGLTSVDSHLKPRLIPRFDQFDASRTGQLNSYDLQRLLAKDSLMEDPREDAVKMLMSELLDRFPLLFVSPGGVLRFRFYLAVLARQMPMKAVRLGGMMELTNFRYI